MDDPKRGATRIAAAGAAAAVVWVVVGALAHAIGWWGVLRGLESAVLPATTAAFAWAWPGVFPALFLAVGAAAVGTLFVAVVQLAVRRGGSRPGLWLPWLATVVAGAMVGLAGDALVIIGSLSMYGTVGGSTDLGGDAALGAYWGLLYGWIPALVVRRAAPARRGAAGQGAALERQHPPHPASPGDDTGRIPHAEATGRVARQAAARTSPGRAVAMTTAAAVLLVALVVVGVLGMRAARVASAQESALAEGADPADGALPDPLAEGDPVATRAPTTPPDDPERCTSEQSTLLLGEHDAATGHRGLSVRLMNFSDAPCVIEGYPDVAFADQNGHALDVVVATGSSFMASDPGAARIEVPAQGYAIAYLGWDANSTAGALVAATLHMAPVPGDERGSWPVETDIVEGSTVEITAWQLDPTNGRPPAS